jgi:hypothetical protein
MYAMMSTSSFPLKLGRVMPCAFIVSAMRAPWLHILAAIKTGEFMRLSESSAGPTLPPLPPTEWH